jgi:hypothetical protein
MEIRIGDTGVNEVAELQLRNTGVVLEQIQQTGGVTDINMMLDLNSASRCQTALQQCSTLQNRGEFLEQERRVRDNLLPYLDCVNRFGNDGLEVIFQALDNQPDEQGYWKATRE